MKRIPYTQEGYDKLKIEYEHLKSERPDAVGHLKRARELGDLSENGYYKASRAKLSSIDSRLRHLKHLLDYGKVITPSLSDLVEIGATITIHDGKGERVYRVVGGFESDPSQGMISHNSPLGKALMGAKVGESRVFETPNGKSKYTVLKITN